MEYIETEKKFQFYVKRIKCNKFETCLGFVTICAVRRGYIVAFYVVQRMRSHCLNLREK